MFRSMRRTKQILSSSECVAILERGTSGVLAVLGDDGFPYTIPLNYTYSNHKLFFHSAKTGHKIDAILANPKVSFCVIDQDQIVPEEYTSYFRSVIAFGKARILDTAPEIRTALEFLAMKYSSSQTEEHRNNAIEKDFKMVCIIEVTIEHLSGKEAIELVKMKKINEQDTHS